MDEELEAPDSTKDLKNLTDFFLIFNVGSEGLESASENSSLWLLGIEIRTIEGDCSRSEDPGCFCTLVSLVSSTCVECGISASLTVEPDEETEDEDRLVDEEGILW